MRLPVVRPAAVAARNRHRPARDRHRRGVDKILVVRARHAVPHRVLAGVRKHRRLGAPLHLPAFPVRRAAIRGREIPDHRLAERRLQRVGVDRMPPAVIHEGRVELRAPARRDRPAARLVSTRAAAATWPNRRLRHRQRAVYRRNVIVARPRAPVQRVGEGVFARAHLRLRACERVARALARRKTVAARRHLVLRQRRAVVRLARAPARQRHRAFGDRDHRGIGHGRVVG